jgi:hypothetical protein
MLDEPETVTAMVARKLAILAIEAAGHDPLKASARCSRSFGNRALLSPPHQSNGILDRPPAAAPQPARDS